MDTQTTIDTFLGFFRERGHHRVTGTSLLPPPGDPVLFTTAGMHPLTPYLLGEPHPDGRRLVSVQRCLRTTDLEEVGDPSHLTVFQMLGSWSLGDYDGPQSLRWGYELITKIFGTERGRLHATVFGGDEQVGPDIQAQRTWEELGVPVEFTTEDNWWSNGPTGPCGPDSELFAWTGDGPPQGSPGTDERWMELWNHVTMRFRRHGDGSLEPLPRINVDTGMGLERLLMVTQGVSSVFGTDVFQPWRQTLPGLGQPDEPSLRLLADHLRASIVITGDGVRPSSSGRGYVLRRLLRRVLTTLWRVDNSKKSMDRPTLTDLPAALLEHTLAQFGQDTDPEVIRAVLRDEERRFSDLMTRGRKVLTRFESGRPLTPEDLSYLHQTHGLPPDLVTEILTGPGETSKGMLGQ